jgi:hypothetical protein
MTPSVILAEIEMSGSSSISATLVGYIIVWAVSAAITGAVAARKNRSTMGWAVGGILFPVTALLVLVFLPYLCPKCQKPVTHSEWKDKQCPRCSSRSSEWQGNDPLDSINSPAPR